MRDALVAHPLVVAVTPIVAGAALRGPADRLLSSLGATATASGVASLYADFCDLFVYDQRDPGEHAKIGALGIAARALDTVMVDGDAAARLARAILASPKS